MQCQWFLHNHLSHSLSIHFNVFSISKRLLTQICLNIGKLTYQKVLTQYQKERRNWFIVKFLEASDVIIFTNDIHFKTECPCSEFADKL